MSVSETAVHQTQGYALITGASGGLGRDFARFLAQKGWNLILVARRFVALTELSSELEAAYGIRAIPLQSDLSLSGAAEELFKSAEEKGRIEILINNAGVGLFGFAEENDSEALERMLMLNCTSLSILSKLAARAFRRRGKGYILNVSSVAGNWPEPYLAAYAATKAYVSSFSVALASELAGSGVSVTTYLPGFIATDFDNNAQIKSDAYKKFSKKNGMPSQRAAEIGLKMMFRRKTEGIAGLTNKLASFFNGLLPRRVQAKISKQVIARLINAR